MAEDGVYEVSGDPLRKIFEMTDFKRDQSIKRFARQLRSIGVDRELRELGVKNGDLVRIFDFLVSFEYENTKNNPMCNICYKSARF